MYENVSTKLSTMIPTKCFCDKQCFMEDVCTGRKDLPVGGILYKLEVPLFNYLSV
jgi:hypothetical protein